MGEHKWWDNTKTVNRQTFNTKLALLALTTWACGGPATLDERTEVIASDVHVAPARELRPTEIGEVLRLGSLQSTPTEIWTLQELQGMSATGNYRLATNIDAGSGFTPVAFSGTFDGGNFVIENLTINLPGASMVGLFSTLSNAVVRNAKLTNVNVVGRSQVGGLAGSVFESTITDSYVEGSVRGGSTSVQGSDFGLFAGEVNGGDIRRSYSRGTLSGLITNAGGFVGSASQTAAMGASFKECYARVNVSPSTAIAGLSVLAGGFIGYATGIDVSDVYTLGSVRGRGPVGGVIGRIDSTSDRPISFYNSYSRNTVTDANGPDRGSTYGALSGTPARLNGLLWDTNVDPAPVRPTAGQIGATTSALKSPTSAGAWPYTSWTTGAWDPGTSAHYHVLRNVVRSQAQLRE